MIAVLIPIHFSGSKAGEVFPSPRAEEMLAICGFQGSSRRARHGSRAGGLSKLSSVNTEVAFGASSVDIGIYSLERR